MDATLLDLAQEILKPHWPIVRNMEENEARQREVERIVNVLKRVAVPALAERQRACIGYPGCDGDLEGEPHSEKCLATALAERQEPPVYSTTESVREEIRNALICDQTTGAGDYDEAVAYAERIVGKAAKNDSQNSQDKSRPGLLLDAIDWWHRRWHQDTGIPCDGISEYCPLIKWNAALAAAAPSSGTGERKSE